MTGYCPDCGNTLCVCGEIRSQAVENVDGRHRYTMEFSTNPEDHAAEYDEEEARLRLLLAQDIDDDK